MNHGVNLHKARQYKYTVNWTISLARTELLLLHSVTTLWIITYISDISNSFGFHPV